MRLQHELIRYKVETAMKFRTVFYLLFIAALYSCSNGSDKNLKNSIVTSDSVEALKCELIKLVQLYKDEMDLANIQLLTIEFGDNLFNNGDTSVIISHLYCNREYGKLKGICFCDSINIAIFDSKSNGAYFYDSTQLRKNNISTFDCDTGAWKLEKIYRINKNSIMKCEGIDEHLDSLMGKGCR